MKFWRVKMNLKEEIKKSVAAGITYKAGEIAGELITSGEIKEKPVSANRVAVGVVSTGLGIALNGNGFVGKLASVARAVGISSLTKTAVDSIINLAKKA